MPAFADGPVVIVEDDTSMSCALSRILRLAGYEALAFTSAEEYLEHEAEIDAMCLVVDVRLAGITGFELQERLVGANAARPVIFITAFDDAQSRRRAGEAGAVVFLTKPFSGRSLLDAVSRATWRRHSRRV